jgi:hypothetical protein
MGLEKHARRTNFCMDSWKQKNPYTAIRNRNEILLFIPALIICTLFLLCIRDRSNPVCPSDPFNLYGPVEDTTRIYVNPMNGDTLEIYPDAIFARFYPWVEDTTQIRDLIHKHNLRIYKSLFKDRQQWVAALCVTDNRRAEYHFTPYGKEGFTNFGADSLVEYAFGVFFNGQIFPSGSVMLHFLDETPRSKIDSLFEALGLRLYYYHPDFLREEWFETMITPKAEKNIFDLGWDFQTIPIIEKFFIDLYTGGSGIECDKTEKGGCYEKERYHISDFRLIYKPLRPTEI